MVSTMIIKYPKTIIVCNLICLFALGSFCFFSNHQNTDTEPTQTNVVHTLRFEHASIQIQWKSDSPHLYKNRQKKWSISDRTSMTAYVMHKGKIRHVIPWSLPSDVSPTGQWIFVQDGTHQFEIMRLYGDKPSDKKQPTINLQAKAHSCLFNVDMPPYQFQTVWWKNDNKALFFNNHCRHGSLAIQQLDVRTQQIIQSKHWKHKTQRKLSHGHTLSWTYPKAHPNPESLDVFRCVLHLKSGQDWVLPICEKPNLALSPNQTWLVTRGDTARGLNHVKLYHLPSIINTLQNKQKVNHKRIDFGQYVPNLHRSERKQGHLVRWRGHVLEVFDENEGHRMFYDTNQHIILK